jgi:hypothetical protein
MRSSLKKRQTQVKEDLAKPTTQAELQGLVEFIHALTADGVEKKERKVVRKSKRKPDRLHS